MSISNLVNYGNYILEVPLARLYTVKDFYNIFIQHDSVKS